MKADVIIAGAGPTGLMLAYELRLGGVEVVLLERLAQRTGESRAGGIHARTMEVLDQRGILDRFLAAGQPVQSGNFSGLRLDFSRFETRYPYALLILQATVEQLLEEQAKELGVSVRWSSEVVGLHQEETGVAVDIQGPNGAERIWANYLVGCDGGRSTIRKLANIDFPGTPATMTAMLGDVELDNPPARPIFQEHRERGSLTVYAFEPGWYRVMTSEHDHVVDRNAPVSLDDLRQSLIRIAGTDYGMHSPRWISRFSDAARQAAQYRLGRVFLAGDAAHIHYPSGWQGLNLGIQDAVNLGWKLASVLRKQVSEDILDSYHAERYPVAQRVLKNTRAQTALDRPDEHIGALREIFGNLIELDEVNRYLGGMITALDVQYPLGNEHPLLGRRVPDLDLEFPPGARISNLLHGARPVLLNLTGDPKIAEVAEGWTKQVDLIEARCSKSRWIVPMIGEIAAPAALLVRPDGYIAWAAPAGAPIDSVALRSALTTWFGASYPEVRVESPSLLFA